MTMISQNGRSPLMARKPEGDLGHNYMLVDVDDIRIASAETYATNETGNFWNRCSRLLISDGQKIFWDLSLTSVQTLMIILTVSCIKQDKPKRCWTDVL